MVDLPIHAFEDIVADTLDGLPTQFRSVLDNVAIVVEEEPTPEMLEDLDFDVEGDTHLLGLYVGTPLTQQSVSDSASLPDRVYIFRGPILRMCDTIAEVRREIRDTVVHELGHHMGLSDEEMPY